MNRRERIIRLESSRQIEVPDTTGARERVIARLDKIRESVSPAEREEIRQRFEGGAIHMSAEKIRQHIRGGLNSEYA